MKTLLLLSGTLCTERLWEGQLERLRGEYHCLFPSLSTHLSVQGLVKEWLSTMPASFSVAGMSAGVVVGLELLRQAEERLEKVAFISGNPNGLTQAQRDHFDKQLVSLKEMGLEAFFETQLFPKSLGKAGRGDEKIKRFILEMARAVGIEDFARQIEVLKSREEGLAVLERSTLPILVVGGAEDQLCPPAFQALMGEKAKKASVKILQNCGHYVNLEKPLELKQLLEDFFLESKTQASNPLKP